MTVHLQDADTGYRPATGTEGVVAQLDSTQGGSARGRKRRRRFAWQSSSSDAACEGDHASESEERSSSASSEEVPVDEQGGGSSPRETVVWHSSVAKADYVELRARGVDDDDAASRPLPPPQGAAAVARRRARLRHLLLPPSRCDAGCAAAAAADSQDEASSWPSEALQEVAAQMRGRGFVVLDAFCGEASATLLREGVEGLAMRPGNLGGAVHSRTLRGDSVAWPAVSDESPFGAALRSWLHRLDTLVAALRSRLGRPSELAAVRTREPPMASCYPPGARYIRHYDNNCDEGDGPDCNARRLTAVYYLSGVGADAAGGHLRLISRHRKTHDIAPSLDTLVLFWADRRTPHEVLPNTGSKRYALSCWYVDADEASNECAEQMPF